MRKKSVLTLDSRYSTMIENSYYMISPPDTPLEQRKERPVPHKETALHGPKQVQLREDPEAGEEVRLGRPGNGGVYCQVHQERVELEIL